MAYSLIDPFQIIEPLQIEQQTPTIEEKTYTIAIVQILLIVIVFIFDKTWGDLIKSLPFIVKIILLAIVVAGVIYILFKNNIKINFE